MRNISFMLTTDQVRDRSKTVTRRLGWKALEPGTVLRGVRKAMGLPKGESVEPLAVIRVTDVRREPLDRCDDADAAREGFPGMTGAEFVAMFREHMGGAADQEVTRIEFEYVDEEPRP